MSDYHRFGPFEVRPIERKLLRDGQPLAVGARAFDVLLALVARRERLVSKAELLDVVWPGLVVEEANVQVQVSALRRLLGPDAIATLPGLGYRLTLRPGPASAPDRAGDGTEFAVPPAPASNTNLPHEIDTLVGRDVDIATLGDWLCDQRLVTLVGPGGIGKTRLAQAVARRRGAAHANGVWWVDLAAVAHAEHLAPAIAHAARLQLGEQGEDRFAALLHAMAGRQLLLVLDNCEHLVADVAALGHALLRAVPGVRLLVTSQAPLHVAGEQVWRLDPLVVPPGPAALAQARQCSAVQLLELRCQAADHRFVLDDDNIGSALALLRQLDGIPLAIELAAARIRMLGLAALADHLANWTRLLCNADPTAPARQRSLQATLQWSHSLLEAREQLVLRQLSVFAAPIDIQTAQAMLALYPIDRSDAVDALAALVDKSLVQIDRQQPPRYRLLETTRLFGLLELQRHAETAAALQAHGQALAQWADEAESRYWQWPDRHWLACHGPGLDDLQAAFDRACQRQDADVAARTGLALTRLDHLRNITVSRRRRAVALQGLLANASRKAQALIWTCMSSHGLIDTEGVARTEAVVQAVAAWRDLQDSARLHFALGMLASERGRARDFDAAEQALAEADSLLDPTWPARHRMWAAAARSGLCIYRGDAEGYRSSTRIELALAEEAGAERAAAWARLKLADAALMAGELGEAITLGQACVTELRGMDQPSNLGLGLSNLCAALLLDGQDDVARATALQALPLMASSGWGYLLFDSMALLAARAGQAERAAQLMGYSDAWYERHNDRRQPNEAALAQLTEGLVACRLPDVDASRHRASGTRLGDAAAQALAALVAEQATAGGPVPVATGQAAP